MAITGNPGDLATGGFGTGISGRAATSRDVGNAVARGESMAAARGSGEGGRSTGGLLSNASPMAPYGSAFDFTPEELTSAIMSMNKAGLPNAGVFDLMSLQSALRKPENMAMSEALGGPLVAYQNQPTPNFSVPSGLLSGAFNQPPLTASMQPIATQQQDMGPLSNAAISAALTYQNSPLENDIAYLASRIGPSASPEALALVEPKFVSELAREIRAAEEATGTTARINDMYRSPDTQGELYTRLKAQDPNYMVAPAGTSWHQAAVAADIARSPVLNYMRANTPASLNFPYDERDLVHVQLSDSAMANLGINKGTRSAFSSTIGDGGFMLAGGDMGQMTPTSVANASPSPAPAPVRSVMAPSGMAFNRGLLEASQPQVASNTSTSAPAQAVMAPGGMSFNAGLLGQQILAGSQPQVVDNSSALEAPPVVRPTGAPTRLASLLFDRGMNRSEERRRRKRKSTNTDQMQSDAIGGLLA